MISQRGIRSPMKEKGNQTLQVIASYINNSMKVRLNDRV